MPDERTPEQQERVKFLKARWDHLKTTNDYNRGTIADDELAWEEKLGSKELTLDAYYTAKFTADNVISRTNRFLMLVAICTFLEEVTRDFARLKFSGEGDFEDHIGKGGSDFERCLKMLETQQNFKTTNIVKELEDFRLLMILRNCVVHQWGNVSAVTDSKKKAKLEKAIANFTDDSEPDDGVSVFKDGCLHFGHIVIPRAIDTAQDIGNEMIAQLMPKKPAYPQ